MFNFKWAVFPAGAAFALAMLASLLFGQVGFGLALARALVFAAVFFGIGCGAWVLVSTHLPELLLFEQGEEDDDDDFSGDGQSGRNAGSRVNIAVGDHGEDALPAALPGDDYGIDGVGSISELVSDGAARVRGGDVDRADENGYTFPGAFPFDGMGDGGDSADGEGARESGSLGDFSAFFDGLPTGKSAGAGPDDSMSDLFESLSGSGSSSRPEGVAPVERKVSGGKPPEMAMDFSPQELAMGIRTALAAEKRG